MPLKQTKEFGIYHWDTFDNVTLFIDEADTLKEAEAKVQERYARRLSGTGADKVDIVTKSGTVVSHHSIM